MTVLLNTEDVPLYDGDLLPAFTPEYQTLELLNYKSIPATSYLAPAHRDFVAVSGLPPDLELDPVTGVISGKVGNCSTPEGLKESIEAYPGSVNMSDYAISGSVQPSTYALGEKNDVIYTFSEITIEGWNDNLPLGPPVKITKVFTIKVLKNYTADKALYESLPLTGPVSKVEIGKKEAQ